MNLIRITGEDGSKDCIECIPGSTSDGYHTFDEVYDHRALLFCMLSTVFPGWKSQKHSDGSEWKGWFIAGCTLITEDGEQKEISYHLPIKYWRLCQFSEVSTAPVWDGYTSMDVIERMESCLLYVANQNNRWRSK